MRKSFVFLICFLAIGLLIIWAGFSNYTIHQNITIHATIDKVALQFSNAKKWSYWHPDLMKENLNPVITKRDKVQEIRVTNTTYLIKEMNPAQIQIYKISASDTTESMLTAAPYKDGTYTFVDYAKKENGFAWFHHTFFKNNNGENILSSLQSFTEDESRRYGFPIKIVPVIDTLILTTGTIAATDSIITNTSILYHRLMAYCKTNSIAPAKDYYYTSTTFLSTRQVNLSVGIPVQKEVHKQQPEFEFLRLPANGHLIAGVYKGRYADKQQLYIAMDEYIQDKRMKKVAQPLEQYNVTDTLFGDNSTVLMRLFYPVF